MEEKFKETFKQAAAFQKMWMDSMSGMTRVWNEYSPQNPPPDELKKVRNGVLKAISQTWEEYMRTPEFLQGMKETMNNSAQWQKWAKENTNKMHAAMGSATKDDIQGVMVALQHVEHRVLDCLEEMRQKAAALQDDLNGIQEKNTKSLQKYQDQVLRQLAEIEKAVKASKTVPASTAGTVVPVKKAASRPASKKAVKKSAKSKTIKGK